MSRWVLLPRSWARPPRGNRWAMRREGLWPAVALHALLNAVVGAQAVNNPQFAETVWGWLLVLALQLPAVVLGIVLILRVPLRPVVPVAA
jgi:hypothetical protein